VRAPLGPVTQCRQRVFGTEENTRQIDRGKPVPFLQARLLDAFAEKDPGIVDQNVEAAELSYSGRDCRRPVLLPADIEVGVNAADSRGSFAPALIEHVTDRDLRSGLGHQFGRRGTDPPRSP
jgi:hypothetical protein